MTPPARRRAWMPRAEAAHTVTTARAMTSQIHHSICADLPHRSP
ncbi:hypothetical protein ACH44C_27275 [Streptomyces purpureus]|nr:hypothetical protein [Streptomyces purpureus]